MYARAFFCKAASPHASPEDCWQWTGKPLSFLKTALRSEWKKHTKTTVFADLIEKKSFFISSGQDKKVSADGRNNVGMILS